MVQVRVYLDIISQQRNILYSSLLICKEILFNIFTSVKFINVVVSLVGRISSIILEVFSIWDMCLGGKSAHSPTLM